MPVPNPDLFGRHRSGNTGGGNGPRDDGPGRIPAPPKPANDNPAPLRLLLLRAALLAVTGLALAWTVLR